MSFTASQWRSIVDAAEYLSRDHGPERTGRYVALDKMQEILRKSRRSTLQNSLIHALFDNAIEAGGEALRGWTREDMKEWALGEYWGWDEFTALGRTKLKPKRRSSSMTKIECAEFTEWFVAKMAEYGIVLSLPGDVKAA